MPGWWWSRNESGVGRGFLTLKDLEAFHARLEGLLETERRGAGCDLFSPTPSQPPAAVAATGDRHGGCAVSELQVDLRKAYVVGDHARDIQLAKAAGVKSILVTSGQVDQQALTMLRTAGAIPDIVAARCPWQQRQPIGFSRMPPHKQHGSSQSRRSNANQLVRERIVGPFW